MTNVFSGIPRFINILPFFKVCWVTSISEVADLIYSGKSMSKLSILLFSFLLSATPIHFATKGSVVPCSTSDTNVQKNMAAVFHDSHADSFGAKMDGRKNRICFPFQTKRLLI